MQTERPSRRRGFTLIELLVVISIISILASLVMGSIILVKICTQRAVAGVFVAQLDGAVEWYREETGVYPGAEWPEGENGFPALYEALFEERPPRGKGGPSAPYLSLKRAEVLVSGEGPEAVRPATEEEIEAPGVPKYIRDPWGNAYVYRENRSRPWRPYMKRPRNADIYSLGRDGVDQTLAAESGDDIGNW